jgi:hypothetical protein
VHVIARQLFCSLHNAAMRRSASLLSLPDELLLEIARWLLGLDELRRSVQVAALASVCSRLRRVAVDAPDLWAVLDFVSSSNEWNELAAHRSRSHPLFVVLNTASASCITGLAHLPRADTLLAFFHETDATYTHALGISLNKKTLLNLRELAVHATQPEKDEVPDHTVFRATHLGLYMFFPISPHLRRLELAGLSVLETDLRRFLDASPQLECISFSLLRPVVELSDPLNQPTPKPARLPHLQVLFIQGSIFSTGIALRMLPLPARTLTLSIRSAEWPIDDNDRPSFVPPLSIPLILKRIEEFQAVILHSVMAVPSLVLTMVGDDAEDGALRTKHAFEIKSADDPPSLLYCHSTTIMRSDPFLDKITHVRFQCRDDMVPDLAVLDLCPAVDNISIDEAASEDDFIESDWAQCASSLETWILGRQNRGRPLGRVAFLGCRSGTHLEALYELLMAGGQARAVDWLD